MRIFLSLSVLIITIIGCSKNNVAPPTAPSLSTPVDGAILTTTNTATLIWGASTGSGPITYNILLGTSKPPTVAQSNSITATQYNANSLSPGTKYYWQVAAVDCYNSIASSTIRSFITKGQNQPPTIPNLSTPIDGATLISTNTVALVWSASTGSNPITYNVLLGTSNPPVVVQRNIAATQYNASSLSVSTTYYWQVIAVDSKGVTASSTTVSFTIGNQPPTANQPPIAPILRSPINRVTLAINTATLVWNASTDPDGDLISYDILLGTSNPPALVQRYIAVTQYKTSSLSVSTTYHWQVVARDSKGAVASSTTASFTTGNQLPQNWPPTTPNLKSPVNGVNLTAATTATLVWNRSTDPDGDPVTYKLLLGRSNPLAVAQSNITATQYNATSLSSNTTYYWQVVASDSKGAVASSTTASFTTAANTVYAGNLVITTQQEVDNFGANGHTKVTGSVTISNTSITNVSALASLTSVGGGLYIKNNNALTSLNGLSSLTLVSNNVEIIENDILTNIDGLLSLTSIRGTLSIFRNKLITNLNGLSGLTSVESINIYNNPALTDFCGVSSLLTNKTFLSYKYTVRFNAYNPTQTQIKSATACKQ